MTPGLSPYMSSAFPIAKNGINSRYVRMSKGFDGRLLRSYSGIWELLWWSSTFGLARPGARNQILPWQNSWSHT